MAAKRKQYDRFKVGLADAKFLESWETAYYTGRAWILSFASPRGDYSLPIKLDPEVSDEKDKTLRELMNKKNAETLAERNRTLLDTLGIEADAQDLTFEDIAERFGQEFTGVVAQGSESPWLSYLNPKDDAVFKSPTRFKGAFSWSTAGDPDDGAPF